MRRTIAFLFIAALAAAPAIAGDNHEGWYIGIEGSGVAAGNADLTLATPTDGTGLPMGKALALDYGSGTAYKFLVGFRNANADCAISFWSYDEDDDLVATSADGFLNALTIPDFGFDSSDDIAARGELESSIIDLTWARPIAKGDKSSFSWILGLRSWSLEQETEVIYDPATVGTDARVQVQSEADGIGLVVGLGAKYDFTDRIWGSSSLRMAFLTGSMDTTLNGNEFGLVYSAMLDGADRNFRQTELDTRINFNVVAGLDLFLGYEFKQFDESSERLFYMDDIQEGAVANDVKDISFSGISAGLSYTF